MSSPTGQHRLIPALNAERQFQLTHTLNSGQPRLERRIRILLLADQGVSVAEIARQLEMSKSGVRYWLNRYKDEGMDILETEGAEQAPDTGTGDAPDSETVGQGKVAPVSLDELRARYSADRPHAEHVASLALRLFDATRDMHGLPEKLRAMLNMAAVAHNLAFKVDEDKYHTLGRDILLQQPIVGMSKLERRMLACIVGLHRKRPRPSRHSAFSVLKKSRQGQVLDLCALLRVANGLDFSHTQTTTITDIQQEDGYLIVIIEGKYADINAMRAQRAADLWHEHFPLKVQIRERFSVEAVQDDVVWARLDPGLTMTETGRRLMGHYLMLAEQHADQLREGAMDSLSVLERDLARLQGVFVAFGEYYDATALTQYKQDVRWLGQRVENALVTRMIAELAHLAAPQTAASDRDEQAGGSEQPSAAPKSRPDEWQREADRVFEKLSDALDSTRYREFLTGLLGLCRTAGAGIFPGFHNEVEVGSQAALLVWQEYARLRAEAVGADDVQKQWRHVHRFHNSLQYMGGLFGPELNEVLRVLQPLEAGLHEQVIGDVVLQYFDQIAKTAQKPEKKGKKKQARSRRLEASLSLLSKRQQERLVSAKTAIQPLWVDVKSAEFRSSLARAIAVP